MTYREIDEMIGTIGLPYAYYQFPNNTGQEPPFVVWYLDGIDDLYADNSNYQRIVNLVVEFYSDEKDFDTEKAIEDVLDASGLTYDMDEQYLDDERMHETIYASEVLINGEQG